ncbi:MAG: beta-ketoacyl synthase chain length factor [Proteobacteria bacterium]|nr:beta-ketoacyl synthase chain length factor [Pseudomonadota bacterium]
MHQVFLNAWNSLDITVHDRELLDFAFFRRMTILQKAVMKTFVQLSQKHPELLSRFRQQNGPIFYSSAYGELSPMIQVSEAILQRNLPISPKEFQHSVQNAALAYLAMSQNLHHPCYALAGGHLSGDNCLYLASQRLGVGLDTLSIIIHAHEYLADQEPARARAEILVLSTEASRESYKLAECSLNSDTTVPEKTLVIFEEDQPHTIPWLIGEQGPYLNRLVRSRGGESLVTRWQH